MRAEQWIMLFDKKKKKNAERDDKHFKINGQNNWQCVCVSDHHLEKSKQNLVGWNTGKRCRAIIMLSFWKPLWQTRTCYQLYCLSMGLILLEEKYLKRMQANIEREQSNGKWDREWPLLLFNSGEVFTNREKEYIRIFSNRDNSM